MRADDGEGLLDLARLLAADLVVIRAGSHFFGLDDAALEEMGLG